MKRTQRNMQAAGETVIPEAIYSPVRDNYASGDLFVSEGNLHRGIVKWRDSRGLAGVLRRGMYIEICTGTGETSWAPLKGGRRYRGKRGGLMAHEESDQFIVLGGRESRPQNSAGPCSRLAGFGVFAHRAKTGEGTDENTRPVQETFAGHAGSDHE